MKPTITPDSTVSQRRAAVKRIIRALGGDVDQVPCLVYSRIVGYLRPIQNWNDAKRQEFDDRVMFKPDA